MVIVFVDWEQARGAQDDLGPAGRAREELSELLLRLFLLLLALSPFEVECDDDGGSRIRRWH